MIVVIEIVEEVIEIDFVTSLADVMILTRASPRTLPLEPPLSMQQEDAAKPYSLCRLVPFR